MQNEVLFYGSILCSATIICVVLEDKFVAVNRRTAIKWLKKKGQKENNNTQNNTMRNKDWTTLVKPVMSVLLPFAASAYLFGIFKRFWSCIECTFSHIMRFYMVTQVNVESNYHNITLQTINNLTFISSNIDI